MKKWLISVISVLALSVSAWALTATGMPALDELYKDVTGNGPLSRRLGFTEEQRKAVQTLIEQETPNLVKLRDELVAAEKKVERQAKKNVKKSDAKDDKAEAGNALNAARDDSFRKLQTVMSEKQYDALKKWRAEGKANTR
jgi:hypothetical protein